MNYSFKKQTLMLLTLLAVHAVSFAATSDSCPNVICSNVVKASKVCTEDLYTHTIHVDTIQTSPSCCASTIIKQSDFMENGVPSKPYIISTPGKYTFGEYINFEPVEENTAAVKVLASNVYIDLCHNELRQTNTTAGTRGIQIGDSNGLETYESITITNGTIAGFSTVGLLAEPGSQILYIYYLTTMDCGGNGGIDVPDVYSTPVSGGMIFRGTQESPVSDIYMSSVKSIFNNSGNQPDVNSCAMCLSFVEISYFQNSHFDDTTSMRIAAGCQYFPVFDLTFRDCSFNRSTGGVQAYGIGTNGYFSTGYELPIILQERVSIINCQAKNITATNDDAYQAVGIQLDASQNCTIQNSFAQEITNNATQLQGAVIPENNPFLPTNAIGISIGHLGNRNRVNNCTVDTISTSGGSAVGFDISESAHDSIVRYCTALSVINTNTTQPELATAVGFDFSLLPSSVSPLFQAAPFGSTNYCENCIAKLVSAPLEANQPGIGILLSGQSKAMVENATVERNDIGIAVQPEVDTNPLVNTTLSLIQNNDTSSNLYQGIVDLVGNVGHNTYIRNQATFNGVAQSGSINFELPVGTPIRLWVTGQAPQPLTTEGNNPSSLDNISRVM